ncbi:cytosolic sulfotransferase 10-like [Rutidosis leptorrhynchoides]|uniref:cytosolic sulfotransferase 10-like n=1 Tax=Rutidosis leptorrhynchoides TaxID=125765 RepID=UPI003A99FB6A
MASETQNPQLESFFQVLKLANYQGFWYMPAQVENIKKFQTQYEAFDDDVLLASPLKTGTAWCKALIASIMNPGEDILPQKMIHGHVPNLENAVYGAKPVQQEPYPLEKAFEGFCEGVLPYGPFFEHILEYWNESIKFPQKILFLKFEDLKNDPKTQVKKLASFLGKSIDDEEIDAILYRCSFKRLKDLEVNQNGGGEWANGIVVPFSSFFRKGDVGDWKNHFTTEMGERLEQIAKDKLKGTGLNLTCEALKLRTTCSGVWSSHIICGDSNGRLGADGDTLAAVSLVVDIAEKKFWLFDVSL